MSAQIMRSNLLLIAGAYSAHTGKAMTSISKKIYGKQDFFDKFRAGSVSPTIDNYFAIVDKFAEAWPDGAPWPETVPVPKLGKNILNGKIEHETAEGIG